MEAKKYRVGNLVIVDNDLRSENGYIHEITEVRALDCQVQLKNLDIIYGQMYKFIKPIKVTSKNLIDLGFKHDLDTNTFSLKPITLYKQDGVFWCDILWDSLEIESIHQLQNLFFALTSKELELKHETSACS